MDSFGSLVDKLSIVNVKLYMAQEFVIEAGTTHPQEFLKKYSAEEMLKNLQRVHMLNTDRNKLITEIDQTLAAAVRSGTVTVDARTKMV